MRSSFPITLLDLCRCLPKPYGTASPRDCGHNCHPLQYMDTIPGRRIHILQGQPWYGAHHMS